MRDDEREVDLPPDLSPADADRASRSFEPPAAVDRVTQLGEPLAPDADLAAGPPEAELARPDGRPIPPTRRRIGDGVRTESQNSQGTQVRRGN